MSITKEDISQWFKSLQDDICQQLENADEKANFQEDPWERPGGGGGRTRVISDGNVLEKGGVNFSAVNGKTPVNILQALELEEADFFATGVSIVLHPNNPWVPIIHMNVRYFEMSNGIWWFGGGIDLTPHYVNKDEASFFHNSLKNICDNHHADYYKRFKTWADEYFYIKHRKETRGIGGIFFDRLGAQEGSKEDLFNFVKEVGKGFAPIYTRFMKDNKSREFSQNEKNWQMLRRGRYVEFNLVWDKGTKFGLDTDGRTESILMSLPPQANWVYDYNPEENSKESETLSLLKKDIDWVKDN
ncbi:oxygen-dependent coproporphyrinogen oxidase [Fulvivirga ligni]|uniref:oxygen-dependent coproporphyrinogen oxidase n=1 Tax=Fulvivirga ligni TaxID=2904246 RepID=UPI001F405F1D|nr:oxygen-dependent coproporphyrinogen oxidase [Fulvivirga ligni]UII20422.1 oxygen-dependent coproporphyrinogen oxidase [Fulvivirga ligni]